MALQVYGCPSIVQGSMIQGSIAQQNEFFRQINSTGEMSSVKGNRLYERADGSIGLAEKSIGYVIGEQLAPIIESVSFTIKSFFCYIGKGFGYLKERVKVADTHNGIMALFSKINQAVSLPVAMAAWNSYQGVVDLPPGTEFYIEGGTEQLALCKRGTTAWSKEHSCDYPGSVAVTVTRKSYGEETVLYHGPYSSSSKWKGDSYCKFSLRIKNLSDKESASIYVHMANHD